MKYIRTTISLPQSVLDAGQARAEQFRLSFSDYLARLIEEEARAKREHLIIVAEDHPPSYPAANRPPLIG